MNNTLTVYQDKETTDQKRRRLATEVNLIKQQLNSKIGEILEEGVDVDLIHHDGTTVSGEKALISVVDCSYQTKRKHYGR